LFSRTLDWSEKNDFVYLANHSLGRPLDRTAEDVQTGLDSWYRKMDAAWSETEWLGALSEFQAYVAALIGIEYPANIVLKTSAGQGLRAVLNACCFEDAKQVVATTGEFDSIDCILRSFEEKQRIFVHWIEPERSVGGPPMFNAESVLKRIEIQTKLVVLSSVFFATGQIMSDIRDIVSAAHAVGAFVVLDVYHAAGVIPLEMERDNVDFVIGGCYKYLRGGPGACYLAIHPRVHALGVSTLDTGWFAKEEPFRFIPNSSTKALGGAGWHESTPPVLIPYQARAGLKLILQLGVQRLREYNLEQQQFLECCLLEKGVQTVNREPEQFGAFLLLHVHNSESLVSELRTEGIIVDARSEFVRICPDILNTQKDLEKVAEKIASLIPSSHSSYS